ncbi:MAG: ribosome assembly RNA-binding protein YhbY [Clostridia bacterium]|nr:ribosome assembly RNA-binding protein YhbY [Clostridia bacterium]
MITTKQRSALRAIAHPIKPLMQLGKGGITENVLTQAEEHLYNAELVKIKVLQNADFTAREIANDFANELNADVVSVIGNIIILYRYSTKEGITHVEF